MKNTDFVRQLYEEEAERLFFFIKKMVEDGEFAEDILQETFCIAMRRADELQEHPRPVAWLYMTAKYVILSECRKKQKRDLNYCYEDMEDLIRDPYAETAMLSMEEGAVKTLVSESEYVILDLVYNQGYRNWEVARKLGIKESTLRVKLLRIRNKLYCLLK